MALPILSRRSSGNAALRIEESESAAPGPDILLPVRFE
jgi:hypothetical protein